MNTKSMIKAILSPLSIISTLSLLLTSTSFAIKVTKFPMTVVTEAEVMSNDDIKPLGKPMICNQKQNFASPSAKINFYRSTTRKAEMLQQINPNTVLFASRNTDDGYLNSVTLWLAIRNGQSVKYFPITEIDMERFELPKIRLDQNTLVIEADTMTIDPKEENEFAKVPTIAGQLYQTIQTGSLSEQGLALNILSCTR